MAAKDNLGPQFMPIEKVGYMHSQYGPSKTVEQAYLDPSTRYDQMEQEYARNKGFNSAQHYQEALANHMAVHGMGNPVRYSEVLGHQFLENGHHRYFAARDNGWKQLEVTQEANPLKDIPGWDDPRDTVGRLSHPGAKVKKYELGDFDALGTPKSAGGGMNG